MNPDFPNNLPPIEEITRLFVEDYPMPDFADGVEDARERERDIAIVKRHAAQLAEHFDSCQVFVTRTSDDGTGTVSCQWGAGSWYARFGQVSLWVKAEEIREISDRTDE